MANEAEIINNPTSTPEAVSTGYQRQNTMIISERVGVDKSVVVAAAASVDVKVSGPVDVNGVLYSIKQAVNLPIASAGRYFIYLSGTGNNLTPTIDTDSGTWDDDKNARYTAGGYRVLNCIISYDGTTVLVSRLLTPEYDADGEAQNYIPDLDTPEEIYITSDGTWTAPRSKYYNIWCTGKGGNGSNESGGQSGAGGGAGATGFIRKFIEAGTVWTATFSSASGGNCTFTDGTTTLTFQNGHNAFNFIGGLGGQTLTGFDLDIPGGSGDGATLGGSPSNAVAGGRGGISGNGISIPGAGGSTNYNGSTSSGGNGANGLYGGGGGGSWSNDSSGAVGGSGGSAIIRIIG